MSSKQRDPAEFQEELVRRFIEQHQLDESLYEPLLRVFRASASGAPTVIRIPGEPSGDPLASVETLLLPEPDSDGAPATLSSLFDGTEESPAPPRVSLPRVRFDSLGLLGRGGMAEVHRAKDEPLHRVLAMKILDARYQDDDKMRARFLAEAQITAQLAHPSIPPVHGVGEIDRGLPYFTMKEVEGVTLSTLIHRVYGHGNEGETWTQTRLLGVFQKVCEAVAYAHARGVVHLDLKPANIMVGDFGEVLVMDWGVARLVPPAGAEPLPPVGLAESARTADLSAVAGTPAYMPPEQALGQGEKLGPAADVYALGVVLFELLCGSRPYSGTQVQLLVMASEGKLPVMESERHGEVHEGLVAIVRRAMDPNPEVRYAHAGDLAEEMGRWLEGSIRRERALAEVRAAQRQLADTHPLRRRAAHLRALAEERLRELGPLAGASECASAWTLEDEATKLEREAELGVAEITQRLNAALGQAPDLREAHELLARIHFDQHQAAERRRDSLEAARLEVLLRAHDVGSYAAYLTGTAALTLETQVPAKATLHRFVEADRQLTTVEVRALGETPLVDIELPVGSYLLVLEAPDRPPVRYPFVLGRMRPWLPRPPGESQTAPLYLPAEGEIGADEVYIPAGWASIGDDALAPGCARGQRVWVDGFAISRDAVRTDAFFRFLGEEEAGAVEARRDLYRARQHLFRPEWPVVGVSFDAARAYAAWRATESGRAVRLPTEVEWEKSARGTDARFHPWGDRFDPTFAVVRAGVRLPRFAEPAPETDRSPYGVRGLGGSVRDWCLDAFVADLPESARDRRNVVPTVGHDALRAVRGGSWRQPPDVSRAAARSGLARDHGHADVGFRLVRPISAS